MLEEWYPWHGLSQGHDLLVGWGWRAGGGFHVAVLDYSSLGLAPHVLLGPCVLSRDEVEVQENQVLLQTHADLSRR